MKNLKEKRFEDANKILFLDRISTSGGLEKVLSSELFFVLKQYFEMADDSYISHIHMEKDGCLIVSLSFKAKRMLIKKETLI